MTQEEIREKYPIDTKGDYCAVQSNGPKGSRAALRFYCTRTREHVEGPHVATDGEKALLVWNDAGEEIEVED